MPSATVPRAIAVLASSVASSKFSEYSTCADAPPAPPSMDAVITAATTDRNRILAGYVNIALPFTDDYDTAIEIARGRTLARGW